MMHPASVAAAGLALLLAAGALAGCTAPAGSPDPRTSPSTSHSDDPESPAGEEDGHTHEDEPIQDSQPDADPDAATEAVAVAVAAVTAYCRPGESKGQWMADLSPLLTDAAVIAYETVDPASIPCTAYAGGATVRDGDDAYIYRVSVPTDAGVYEAHATRERTSDPWRIDRMVPAE